MDPAYAERTLITSQSPFGRQLLQLKVRDQQRRNDQFCK